MPLAAGQTLSYYRILDPLGVGAMGEVYRAEDTRLDREVAIKVLPEHLADDGERLRRFEREAKSLASLNHPNVAQIFGVDQAEETFFLVLELVPGETLEERIARGPLPVDEAIDVCRQIAAGLEAAHEAGVVHRDLKPANVRITPGGMVKVLDFGLAKPTGPEAAAESTTDSVLSTEEGRLLGTPTYMAPEQARGRPIDRRVDVWAFGCVLYECLTATRAFGGETLSDVLASVLEHEPDWSRLPAATPPRVRELVARCLVKDPYERLRDVGDARLELLHARAPRGTSQAAQTGRSRAVPAAVAGFALGALLTGALARFSRGDGAAPAEPVRRFSLHGIDMLIDAFQGLALAPDGSRLVYRARGPNGVDRLFVREFDAFEARPLEGTDFGWLPFFSPDGDRVGFYSDGYIGTVSLSGGLKRKVVSLDGGFTGGAWLPDDSLIISHDGYLARIPAGGSALERIELDDPAITIVTSPWPLPGGRAVLCSVRHEGAFDVAAVSLDDGAVHVLAENGFTPTYAATGHVLFQQGTGGPLMALPFDAERLAATGTAFPVLSDVGTRVSYQVRMFTVAQDGTLAYIPESAELGRGALFWVDREGEPTPITERPSVVFGPRLSSDDRRIAFRTPAVNCDLWVHDLDHGSTTRITLEGDNHGVAWSTDDGRILFCREVGSAWALHALPSDGSGDAEQLSEAVIPAGYATSCSPDDGYVLISTRRETTGADVDLYSAADQSVRPLLSSRFEERAAVFSHDGRYIAYVSDQSGQPEVYVQPFPALDARVQISTDGGVEPVWSPKGDALFFRGGGRMMEVHVTTSPTFSADRPAPLFEDVYARRGSSGLPDYDVSRDGQRFVMIRDRAEKGGAQVHVVLHWFDELRAAGSREGER